MARGLKSLMRDRRGTQKTYFVLAELVLLVLIAVAFMAFVVQLATNTMMEKNYFARDLALVLDTAYASPGNLNYEYEGNASKFIVAFDNNRVGVKMQSDVLAKEYWFADSGQGAVTEEFVEPEDIVFISIDSQVLVRDNVIS